MQQKQAKDIFAFMVSKEEILECDIKGVVNSIEQIEKKLRGDACQSIAVYIDGYNDVSDELYEIDEVRAWVQKLFERIPHFMYYINIEVSDHNYLIASLSDDVTSVVPFERRPIQEYDFHEWKKLPKVNVQLRLPNEKIRNLIQSVVAHGSKMGNKKGADEVAGRIAQVFMGTRDEF